MKKLSVVIVAAVLVLIVVVLAVKLIGGAVSLVSGAFNAILGLAVIVALILIVAWMFAYARKNK